MDDTSNRLAAAVDDVMAHNWSNTRPAMTALQVLIDTASETGEEIERLRALIQTIGDKRHTYGWSPEADAAIYAALDAARSKT